MGGFLFKVITLIFQYLRLENYYEF
jgi:hypothetical protein